MVYPQTVMTKRHRWQRLQSTERRTVQNKLSAALAPDHDDVCKPHPDSGTMQTQEKK